ncbi:hypothetical protein EMIT0215P_50108 [Pseudomonas serboccidentalis]
MILLVYFSINGFIFSASSLIYCHWQSVLTAVAVPLQDGRILRSHDEDYPAHPKQFTPALGSSAVTCFVS